MDGSRTSARADGQNRVTTPLASRADPRQLDAVYAAVQGRRVVVVGSAPLKTRYVQLGRDELALPVNGAISSVDPAEPIALWIVGSKPYDRHGASQRTLHRLMLDQARGRQVGHAVLLRQPNVASELWTLDALESRGCRVRSWSCLDKPTKRWIEGFVCGRVDDAQPCSSGILAAALALYSNAVHVRLVGFSLQAGYHYSKHLTPAAWWRNHLAADARALAQLAARYGDRLSGAIVAGVVS